MLVRLFDFRVMNRHAQRYSHTVDALPVEA